MATLVCVDPELLAAYVDGTLADREIARVDRHIDACVSCRTELSTLAALRTTAGLGSGGGTADIEPPPLKLGRYELQRELGRGAMGVVVRAWDPELARAVAIKVLDPVAVGSAARDLLRAEAQALARLNHPHVVKVYDVATVGETAFVAMELVEGKTLSAYVATPRTWRDVLAVCASAGRGLAAAHDAGLVHRDFKPDNVLCADDGRVLVSDFGLARSVDAGPSRGLAGTPVYMAPEVLRGEPATPASDQFSFCVAVYEALYGVRPFRGATAIDELRAAIAAGLPAAPSDAAVPARIRAVLARGLAVEPGARFADLHAVVDALVDAPGRRRRTRIAIAAGLGAAVVAGALVTRAATGSGPACAIDDAALGPAWSADRRQAVARAVRAAGGEALLPSIEAALDRYAADWLGVRREACEATHVRGDQTAAVLELRVACLDGGRRAFGELTSLLATADRTLALRAVDATQRLPDPGACTAGAVRETTLPVNPAAAGAVERAREGLARGAALFATGKEAEARAVADQVLAAIAPPSPHDVPALAAETLLLRARAEGLGTEPQRAEATLYAALTAAQRAHADHLVAEIWIELVELDGARLHRFELADAAARAADAALARIEAGRALTERYAFVLGSTLVSSGKLDAAKVQLARALSLVTEAHPGHLGSIENARCDLAARQRDFDAARTSCTRAVDAYTATFGATHPRVAVALNTFGALELARRDLPAAEQRFTRALQIYEAAGATDDITYALASSNLGITWMQQGDLSRAESQFQRARAVFARHHPDHPQRHAVLQSLASVALRRGVDYAAAVRLYEEARALIERAYGRDSANADAVLYNLAYAHRLAGHADEASRVLDELIPRLEARAQWGVLVAALTELAQLAEPKDLTRSAELLEHALRVFDKHDDPSRRAYAEYRLGKVYARLKRAAEAIPLLERAVTFYAAEGAEHYQRGLARFALAELLWARRADRARARELARQAADDFAKATNPKRGVDAALAALTAWRRDHGGI